MRRRETEASATPRRARRTKGEWIREVTRWRRSGKTAPQYASDRGLNASTLAWWASRLGGHAAGQREASLVARRDERGALALPTFLPVQVVARKARESVTEVSAPRAFEIVLANGRRVLAGSGCDLGELGRLLAVVEGGVSC
jgi:transposase